MMEVKYVIVHYIDDTSDSYEIEEDEILKR